MKTIFSLLLTIFYIQVAMTQSITQEEAFKYAQKLYEIEILSEKGKQVLEEFIKTPPKPNQQISKSYILSICGTIFYNEQLYRLGVFERSNSEIVLQSRKGKGRTIIKESGLEEFDSLNNQIKVDKEYEQKMQDFEGFKLEENIKNPETVTDNSGMVIYPPLINYNNPPEHGLVHNNRSVLGKTLRKTLKDLLKIALIDSLIYNEIDTSIEQKEITQETNLFSKVIERTAYYESYDNKAFREKEFLRVLSMNYRISEENHQKLLQYHQDTKLIGYYEILKNCQDIVFFQPKKYSEDNGAIYQILLEKLKNIVPDFTFDNLQIDIEDIEYEPEYLEHLGEEIPHNASISFKAEGIKYNSTFQHFGRETMINLKFLKMLDTFLVNHDIGRKLYVINKYNIQNNIAFGDFFLILLNEEELSLLQSLFEK